MNRNKLQDWTCVLLIPTLFAWSTRGDVAWENGVVMLMALLVIRFLGDKRLYLFVASVLLHLLCFPWLAGTLQKFGGFPTGVSFALFLLFACLSSLQFVAYGWLLGLRIFPASLHRAGLVFPLAWTVADYLVPKLFPWTPAHFFLGIKSVAMLASVFGQYGLTFLLCWLVANIAASVEELWSNRQVKRLILTSVCTTAMLAFGHLLARKTGERIASADNVLTAIAQGNLSTEVKGKSAYLKANLEVYAKMSDNVDADLLVWPESVMTTWTPVELSSLSGTKYDPHPERQTAMLYGVLSYERRSEEQLRLLEEEIGRPISQQDVEKVFEWYNSAMALDSDGRVTGVYHKRALMPLGEYLPMEEYFPWIRNLSPQSGHFSVGRVTAPLAIKIEGLGRFIKAGVLVCYEDLVPGLSRDYVHSGAEVLINVTNDAWYGATAAPFQHEILAAWRALENGRTLVRATNTGATAVIYPDGEIRGRLPIFTTAIVRDNVPLLQHKTQYVIWGWLLPILMCGFVLLLLLGERFSR